MDVGVVVRPVREGALVVPRVEDRHHPAVLARRVGEERAHVQRLITGLHRMLEQELAVGAEPRILFARFLRPIGQEAYHGLASRPRRAPPNDLDPLPGSMFIY